MIDSGDVARIATLSDQAPTAIIGFPHMTLPNGLLATEMKIVISLGMASE
jgi:hypothetical protein